MKPVNDAQSSDNASSIYNGHRFQSTIGTTNDVNAAFRRPPTRGRESESRSPMRHVEHTIKQSEQPDLPEKLLSLPAALPTPSSGCAIESDKNSVIDTRAFCAHHSKTASCPVDNKGIPNPAQATGITMRKRTLKSEDIAPQLAKQSSSEVPLVHALPTRILTRRRDLVSHTFYQLGLEGRPLTGF
ncbi:hypothetical protein E8E12_006144 [Didymella heteroderae]|uniref:Uncharacterized protein n=1 Tax=Didymella heteroderae TaxID=1769908 RepID=A0A9P5C2S6_9PLEO|nr:hypothetical protein E8E12_006144 [Didymella heteroderae]